MGKGKKRQVGTMREVIEKKRKEDRSSEQVIPEDLSSSQPHSSSRVQTRSQQHISSKLQAYYVSNRPQSRSQGLNQEQAILLSQTNATSSRVVPEATNSSTTTSIPSESTTINKGRGPAQFPKFWGTGKKLEVSLNKNEKVIGPDAMKFKSALGCLARIGVKLPLNYMEFKAIPQYLRDIAWEEVEYNTTLPPEAKKRVMSDLNDIWRKWKHKIKTDYFLPHKDDEEYLSQLPTDRIELDQWLDLVIYWNDEEVQKIAAKNAENVEKKQCLHRTGRTPFTIVEQGLMMEGIDPTDLDVWMESRALGCLDDEDTSDLYIHFKQELSKKSESERTREFKEELFKKVMGENHTRVKCLERKRKRDGLAVFASKTLEQQEDKEEMQKLKNEMIEERGRLDHMRDEYIREKEELRVDKEKLVNLTKKLEMLISRYPTSSAMSHSAQIVGGKAKKQKNVQDCVNSIKIGTRVYLFCSGIATKVVAQGIVVALIDEENEDDHVFVKVYVEKAVIPNAKLSRPHEGAKTIGEAIHKCINWELVDVTEI